MSLCLPTRLLDSGFENCPSLHLRESSKELSAQRYVTLSHCWGNKPVYRLLERNKEEFLKGIDVNKLHLTFREAVSITRKLGVRYLWIDSLCIIQDLPANWLNEASKMGDVYRNSYLNLAASSARNGEEGLFRDKKPVLFNRCNPFNDVSQTNCKWFMQLECDDTPWCDIDFRNSPLHSRAWVLQEIYLAPRMIHFASTQLFWKCKQHFASERYVDGHPFSDQKPLQLVYPKRDTSQRPSRSKQQLHAEWTAIVEDYWGSRLTVDSDRVPAISGIAQDFSNVFKSQGIAARYLAGLWDSFLIHDLLWYIDVPQYLRFQRPQAYRAPSWSWMSVDGKVEFHSESSFSRLYNDAELLTGCEVVEAATTPVD